VTIRSAVIDLHLPRAPAFEPAAGFD